jgi:hypothetical protein
MNDEIDIQELLKHFRELVGAQAQEIVMLKAMISSNQKPTDIEPKDS